jgi:2'-5' RNA ligase
MGESALSVEVPEAEDLVGPWRLRHDPLALQGVPCHITVLYPFVAPEGLDDPVLDRVRQVLAGIRPFDFSLAGLGEFPGVLWLKPDPNDGFRQLTQALQTSFPEHRPYGGRFPNTQPHLTVAKVDVGEAQHRLRAQLDTDFGARLPIACRASNTTVWASDDSGYWVRRVVLPFGE